MRAADLGHRATGGFMRHCGWNSSIESVTIGVAMAAWPTHPDQPRNTVLIAGVLKVGVVVRKWREMTELVEAWNIGRLMASEEGCEIRRGDAAVGRRRFSARVEKE